MWWNLCVLAKSFFRILGIPRSHNPPLQPKIMMPWHGNCFQIAPHWIFVNRLGLGVFISKFWPTKRMENWPEAYWQALTRQSQYADANKYEPLIQPQTLWEHLPPSHHCASGGSQVCSYSFPNRQLEHGKVAATHRLHEFRNWDRQATHAIA